MADSWEVSGFRVLPCSNVDSVWVEVEPVGVTPVELSPDAARTLGTRLIEIAADAERGRIRRGAESVA